MEFRVLQYFLAVTREQSISGDITIGAGETDGIRYIAKAAKRLQTEYPLVHFHIVSGDKTSILEDLDRGLIDFALLFGNIDTAKYEYLELPCADQYGVILRQDDTLAEKEVIAPEDMIDKPLIVSRQLLRDNNLISLLGCNADRLHIAATYNLLFNGSIMVDEGMGYAISFDKINNTSCTSSLCYRPISRPHELKIGLTRKKYQAFTKAAEK